MYSSRNALILNFTGNAYHWGCFGTSYEIYQTLLERGYVPSFLSVDATHALRPTPRDLGELMDARFMERVLDAQPFMRTALAEADVIVVNGEGTLYRLHHGPRNLLFLLHAAREYFDKPVHLINHSFYPSGTRKADRAADKIYGTVVSNTTKVVSREIYSTEVLQRLGIPASQGFDCLTRFITRYHANLISSQTYRNRFILSGGVTMTEQSARQIARTMHRCRNPKLKLLYLAGAKSQPASEDKNIYGWMRDEIPDLELHYATSMNDWLSTIASATGLVSGRFHHTLAAATLGTPAIVFPSNTPKIHAVCEMLSLNHPIAYDDPKFEEKLAQSLAAMYAGNGRVITKSVRQKILNLANTNFIGL